MKEVAFLTLNRNQPNAHTTTPSLLPLILSNAFRYLHTTKRKRGGEEEIRKKRNGETEIILHVLLERFCHKTGKNSYFIYGV